MQSVSGNHRLSIRPQKLTTGFFMVYIDACFDSASDPDRGSARDRFPESAGQDGDNR